MDAQPAPDFFLARADVERAHSVVNHGVASLNVARGGDLHGQGKALSHCRALACDGHPTGRMKRKDCWPATKAQRLERGPSLSNQSAFTSVSTTAKPSLLFRRIGSVFSVFGLVILSCSIVARQRSN
jgi:hypothetical protein